MLRFLVGLALLPLIFGALAYAHTCLVSVVVMPLIALVLHRELYLGAMFIIAPWFAGIHVLFAIGTAAKFLLPASGGARFFALAYAKAMGIVNAIVVFLFWAIIAIYEPDDGILWVLGIGLIVVAQAIFPPLFRAAAVATPFEEDV